MPASGSAAKGYACIEPAGTRFATWPDDGILFFETTAKIGHVCRPLHGLAYVCAQVGRTSPQAAHQAGPHCARSGRADTIAEEANRWAHFALRKDLETQRELGNPVLRPHSSGYFT